MIADSTRNRIITRAFVTIVASISPISLLFSLYIVLFNREIFYNWKDVWFVLFGWCFSESAFWVWSVLKYKSQCPVFDRVVPSLQERQKLKEDTFRIIDSCRDGGTEFLEGWFKTRKQKARIQDLQQGNIKDWYNPTHLPPLDRS